MITALTGIGLSTAAGLNAYVPLLLVGLIARFTDLLVLGDSWTWLEHPVTLTVLAVLLAVEFLADKFPAVDSINDVLQTVVRPSSGGIVFGAGASAVELSEITGAASGAAAQDGVSWGAVIVGTAIALVFHLLKFLGRLAANSVTAGCAAPFVSFIEDIVSFLTSLAALLLPALVLLVVPALAVAGLLMVRRSRRLRAGRTGEGSGGSA